MVFQTIACFSYPVTENFVKRQFCVCARRFIKRSALKKASASSITKKAGQGCLKAFTLA